MVVRHHLYMKTNCFAYILLINDLFHNTEYNDNYGAYNKDLEGPAPAPAPAVAMRSLSKGMGQNQSSRSRSASHQNWEEGMRHPFSRAATRFHEEDHVYHSSSNHQAYVINPIAIGMMMFLVLRIMVIAHIMINASIKMFLLLLHLLLVFSIETHLMSLGMRSCPILF